MEIKRFQNRSRSISFFLISFSLVFLILSAGALYKNKADRNLSVTLNRFQSDFIQKDTRADLRQDQILKKNKFFAFGAYSLLPPGIYEAIFHVNSISTQQSEIDVQIAAEKGKTVLNNYSIQLTSFPGQHTIQFKILNKTEVEPRLLYISGHSDIQLDEVTFHRIRGVFPLRNLFFISLFSAFFITLLLMSVFSSLKHSPRWIFYLTLFFFLAGSFLILRNAWVSEDAFITLRHVENFTNGFGPVFNVNERVEGYSHPLWFAILSLFRWIGMSPKASVILPGLFFSMAALYILFFRIHFPGAKKNRPSLNPAAVILIGTSAFIDFGTSGLETSLSYFLLIIFAKFLAEDRWKSQPASLGLIVTFLVLTRPDFGIFLIALIIFYLYKTWKKDTSLKQMASFITPPLLILGIHEIFRMGYYAALFPNPFYSKSGDASYFSQGLKYLFDFGKGSLIYGILFLAVFAIILNFKRVDFRSRVLVLLFGALHGFFVIRGGGDFMHGRFLLPAIILITVSVSGAFDRFFENKVRMNQTYLTVSLIIFVLSLSVLPVQKKGQIYNHGISNERYAYYKNQIIPLKYLFKDTVILMWKTIGVNYRDLSLKSKLNIRLAYLNVGFTGFYSGRTIYLIDRLGLTDPIVSRISLVSRGRPGHEKSARFGYLILKKLTFGDTPYPLWNEMAATKYGVLWDISPKTLGKLNKVLDKDLKKTIDDRVEIFLNNLNEANLISQADFLFFLNEFWYPYASNTQQNLFDSKYQAEFISLYSESQKWIIRNRENVELILSHLEGPLTLKAFVQNIKFALTQGRSLKF